MPVRGRRDPDFPVRPGEAVPDGPPSHLATDPMPHDDRSSSLSAADDETHVVIHGFRLPRRAPFPVAAAVAYSDEALRRSSTIGPGLRIERDRRWGPGSWQSFDVFAPETTAAAPRPIVVFFHGGGWVAGHKEWCGFMAPAVCGLGAVLVAATHRLAPAHRYPVFVEDALDAVAAIVADAPSWGGDPNRIFLAGHSAGGHVAAQIGLRPDLWRGRLGANLAGVLPISAALDLHTDDPAPGSLEEQVYTTVLARPEDDLDASPLHAAGKIDTPVVLAWGEFDAARVIRSNEAMARRLLRPGAPHRALPLAGLDHFATHLALEDAAHPWYAALADLLAARA